MTYAHDPDRVAGWLRQCLGQSKKPIGVFLGAGCPLAVRVPDATGKVLPLIPDIAGLTTNIRGILHTTGSATDLDAVCGHLKQDGNASPTIEDILTHIRSLRRVAGSAKVRGISAVKLDELDNVICEEIVRQVKKDLPPDDTPYARVAAWMGAIERDSPLEVFTTNYDLLVEQALEAGRVPYFDGFVGSNRPFFDAHSVEDGRLPARWTRLWKLHGSINWRQDSARCVSRGEIIEPHQRRVIHPSHLKYEESRRMPYLAMIDRLRGFLSQPSPVLVTCGFSYRDAHLNAVIIEALEGNPSAIVFALIFGSPDDHAELLTLAQKRPNLSVLGKDSALIGGRRGNWQERAARGESDASAIDWEPINPKDPDGPVRAQFRLGDFQRFGRFVQDLVGPQGEQAMLPK
jgi:hypothetical protein